jgi:hypothetical protein
MIFRTRKKPDSHDASAEPLTEADLGKSTEQLLAEIDELTRVNRQSRDPRNEIRLLQLRYLAGVGMLQGRPGDTKYPEPAFDALPDRNGDLAGITPEQLTPEVLRAGILRDGCLLVRGAVGPRDAKRLVKQIHAAWEARDKLRSGKPADGGYYQDFVEPVGDPRAEQKAGDGEEPVGIAALREFWVSTGGGLWVADSPHLMFEMLDSFERAGLVDVIRAYLGERPTISIQKCTLRKVDPDAGHGWHQDGAFMGDVRAINVWLALSRCGDEAPGMDIVPKRLDRIVATGTEGAIFDWSVSPQVAAEAAGEAGILRPIFEPGDVLLFDDLFLHSTAAEPSMKKSRLAIESWFFGASASPAEYAPLAV